MDSDVLGELPEGIRREVLVISQRTLVKQIRFLRVRAYSGRERVPVVYVVACADTVTGICKAFCACRKCVVLCCVVLCGIAREGPV